MQNLNQGVYTKFSKDSLAIEKTCAKNDQTGDKHDHGSVFHQLHHEVVPVFPFPVLQAIVQVPVLLCPDPLPGQLGLVFIFLLG